MINLLFSVYAKLSSRGKRRSFFHFENSKLGGGIILLFWLGGCATPQSQALLKLNSHHLPQQVELVEVPYYPQETHQCGPAALATVLNAGGSQVTPQDLTPEVYLPGREGSLQVEMLAATRRNGLLAYELSPRLEDMLREVAAGTPVVVLQNLGLSWYPVWHYAVVVGYDLEREEIILRSGRERRQLMQLTTFEHTWRRSGYWAMLAMPPDKLPQPANTARTTSSWPGRNFAKPNCSLSCRVRSSTMRLIEKQDGGGARKSTKYRRLTYGGQVGLSRHVAISPRLSAISIGPEKPFMSGCAEL